MTTLASSPSGADFVRLDGGYTMQQATLSNLAELATLEAASFPPDEMAEEVTVKARIADAGKFFQIVTTEASAICGFVNGTCITAEKITEESMTEHEPSGRSLVIHSVTVDPAYRRKGTALNSTEYPHQIST
jgi:hypothetical protein